MISAARRRVPWWLAVFALALAARVAYLALADEPLVYKHQHQYFHAALRIIEHPDPWSYVLRSDEWRRWIGVWTIAPLYQLFAVAVLALFGPQLLPLQLAQCGLDAAAAALLGAIGRSLAGPRGAWAGVAYALYWPAVATAGNTLTENLHTPLLVAAVALLLRDGPRAAAGGGFLLGLSALARSVSSAFLPIAALWRGWLAADAAGGPRSAAGRRAGARAALLVLAGGAAAILPWSARNAWLAGDAVLIDSMGVYNLWDDDSFYDGRTGEHHRGPTPDFVFGPGFSPAERRRLAMGAVREGLLANPGPFAAKAWVNFTHFLRPETLHLLLVAEDPDTLLRYALALVFEDVLVLAALVLFSLWACAGARAPGRWLVLGWVLYYAFMVVVVFHNEIRYRSAFVPLLFAGAMGGLPLVRPARGVACRAGALLAVLLAATSLLPYLGVIRRASGSVLALSGLCDDVARGGLEATEARVAAAAARDPGSTRPWLRYARCLLRAGRLEPAIQAYRRAQEARPDHWVPLVALPPLLRDAGRAGEALVPLKRAHERSREADPWLPLEIAWRELPPPRGSEVRLGGNDYGAVRDFGRPLRDHRWTRHHATLRLLPDTPAAAYHVTLVMGSPEPSPFAAPTVRVRAGGGAPARFTLSREMRPYVLRAAPAPGEPLLVEIEAPTWSRSDQPPEQGIAVERMAVGPAG